MNRCSPGKQQKEFLFLGDVAPVPSCLGTAELKGVMVINIKLFGAGRISKVAKDIGSGIRKLQPGYRAIMVITMLSNRISPSPKAATQRLFGRISQFKIKEGPRKIV